MSLNPYFSQIAYIDPAIAPIIGAPTADITASTPVAIEIRAIRVQQHCGENLRQKNNI